MALFSPAVAAFAGDGGGLLGGGLILSGGSPLGDGGILGGTLGNGCKEDELVSVGGDAGVVGVNLAGDLDLDHGLLSLGGKQEDDTISVGGDSGLVGLLGNDPDLFREGLLGVTTHCEEG